MTSGMIGQIQRLIKLSCTSARESPIDLICWHFHCAEEETKGGDEYFLNVNKVLKRFLQVMWKANE